MIAVCNITLICNSRNNAKSLLQTFCELIGCTFNRWTIDTESNVRLLFPLVTCIVHVLHNIQCKWCSIRICMGFSCHIFHTLVKSCISKRNRWISSIEKFINRFSLLQAGKCSELPQNRCCVRQCSFQTVVSAHQCAIAKFQSVIKDLPELIHISTGRKCNVNKVDRNNSLIETSVELVVSVLVFPWA